ECWSEGRGDHPLIVAPTGSGKSVILGLLCSEAVEWPGTRVCVVTHRKELVEQDARAIIRMTQQRVGIYNAALGMKELHHPVTVATIQSIYQRAPHADPWDIIIVDEAHLVPPESTTRYRRFLSEARLQNPQLKIVGLTATPYRMGSGLLHEGSDALFDTIAYEITIPQLLEEGHLCEIISRGGLKQIDTSKVHVRGGEYVASELARAADDPDTTRTAVADIVRYGADRRGWLVFAAGVAHARHITDEIRSHGIAAELVTGDTPAAERTWILREYKEGRIRCLVSCEVLTTGFDAPHTDLLGMLRPTKSPVLYVQMVGRGMRPADGKDDCLLLDFAGVVLEHGPVDQVNVRSRGESNGGEPGEAPVKVCPDCQLYVAASARVCTCGHEFPFKLTPELQPKAYAGAVLSHQRTQEVLRVEDMRLSLWEPLDPGRPNTLLVTYRCGLREVREWLCPEHVGYARQRFEMRCIREWKVTPPASIEEALEIEDEIPVPTAIVVQPQKDRPKYLEVVRRIYEPIADREPGEDDVDEERHGYDSFKVPAAAGDVPF
ncbi:MAG: DEAD/DEAH box helicase, partial [Gemmatimonadota bacterium]|nr:DEAD/DEAH box helicase [Gemmatimonadota bacterium]